MGGGGGLEAARTQIERLGARGVLEKRSLRGLKKTLFRKMGAPHRAFLFVDFFKTRFLFSNEVTVDRFFLIFSARGNLPTFVLLAVGDFLQLFWNFRLSTFFSILKTSRHAGH